MCSVIINRKTGIVYLASKTILKRDISQVVILGAGLAPLDVDLICRHTLGDMELFSVDLENMPLKRNLLERLSEIEAGEELDSGQRIATIGNFIERELKRLEGKKVHHDKRSLPDEQLDELFRTRIAEVWQT